MLLEPILEIRLRVPPECAGRIISDVSAMRGEVTEVQTMDEFASMTALVPVS